MNALTLDRRAVAVTARLVDATRSDQLDLRTPCPDWTVRDLVAHLIAGNVKYIPIALGADWIRGAPPVDPGPDPAATYRRTAQELLEAWDEPGAFDREIALPLGRRGRAEEALSVRLGETLAHGWDLARATGQVPDLEPDVVEAALARYQSWLPPQRPEGSPFAPAAAAEDAPAIDRLAAYLGRDVPAWS